jgi:hypothetical protein
MFKDFEVVFEDFDSESDSSIEEDLNLTTENS